MSRNDVRIWYDDDENGGGPPRASGAGTNRWLVAGIIMTLVTLAIVAVSLMLSNPNRMPDEIPASDINEQAVGSAESLQTQQSEREQKIQKKAEEMTAQEEAEK